MKLKVLLDNNYFKIVHSRSIVYICFKSKPKDVIHYQRYISYIDIFYIKKLTVIVKRNRYFVERNGWIQIPIIGDALKNISPVSKKTFYRVIRNYNIGNEYDCKIPNS